jgi:dephospho-CoA kinase
MKQLMLIIGLTGGIGMGKSTAAKILRGFGLPVYNADHAVHALLKKGGKGVKPVARLFPESEKRGAINRTILGQMVFHHHAKLKQLEKILHPLVRDMEKSFLQKARREKAAAAILEIPLLFETGAQKRCDYTLCVTAARTIQKTRVMNRPGMTEARFNAIVKRQLPDKIKRKMADFVVHTGKSYLDTKQQLAHIIKILTPDP